MIPLDEMIRLLKGTRSALSLVLEQEVLDDIQRQRVVDEIKSIDDAIQLFENEQRRL